MEIITHSYLETQEIGYKLAKHINPNSVILLDGDLATGKTTFTQGLAKGLGVTEQVNSPSFVIMKGYEGTNSPFFHLDLYRLEGVGYDFDLEEYYEDSVAVIEWPYQVKELLPKEYLLIKFTRLSENERKLEFLPVGKKIYRGLKMYRLIIDSSTKIMYVGLTQNLNLIDKKIRIAKRDHAKYLVDEIDQLLSKNNLKITDIKEIIVGNGPGSYTGLRVAGMVAKMLAYTKNIILKEVASPFFLTSGYEEKVTGLIDARRNQFFMGTYDNLTTVIPEQIGQLDDFYTNNDFLESRKVLIDENNYLIDAAKIILKATIVEDVHSYTPNYIRKTEAERNYDQKSEI